VNNQTAKICTSGIATGSLVTMATPHVHILVVWLQLYHTSYAIQSGLPENRFLTLVHNDISVLCVGNTWTCSKHLHLM